jgi:hypothetical protein
MTECEQSVQINIGDPPNSVTVYAITKFKQRNSSVNFSGNTLIFINVMSSGSQADESIRLISKEDVAEIGMCGAQSNS